MRAFVIAVGLMVGCGGGDGGGDDDRGDPPDESDAGADPAGPIEGQFSLVEVQWGEDGFRTGRASGSILDPHPRYHRLWHEEGGCRYWMWGVPFCLQCDGICDYDQRCIPFRDPLSAGTVAIEVNGTERAVLSFEASGYVATASPDEELFAEGDSVEAIASGGDDVAGFTLAASAVDAITIDLERDPDGEDQDKLELVYGKELVLSWSPSVPGTRVRLEIPSNNRGHGLPVDALIECEAEDTGEITVPSSMVDAFPERTYGLICVGSDCPPGTLTRFRADRVEVDGGAIDFVVGAQRQFVPVKSRPVVE